MSDKLYHDFIYAYLITPDGNAKALHAVLRSLRTPNQFTAIGNVAVAIPDYGLIQVGCRKSNQGERWRGIWISILFDPESEVKVRKELQKFRMELKSHGVRCYITDGEFYKEKGFTVEQHLSEDVSVDTYAFCEFGTPETWST